MGFEASCLSGLPSRWSASGGGSRLVEGRACWSLACGTRMDSHGGSRGRLACLPVLSRSGEDAARPRRRCVSPADGEVIYVSESQHGVLPTAAKSGRRYTLRELVKTSLVATDATVIGIALNFLDVHVNRAPIAGRVVLQQRHGGPFRSLRKLESVFDNERVTIVIEKNGFEVAVVLIASRLVRRIAEFVHEGETVVLGQRIGAIRFGSQVDVVVPHGSGFKVLARTGQRVVAGESVLAVTGRATRSISRRCSRIG